MLLALEKKFIKDALNNNLPEWSISEKGYVGFWKSKFLCNFFIYNGGYATQKQRHNCAPKTDFLFVSTETSEKPLTFETD